MHNMNHKQFALRLTMHLHVSTVFKMLHPPIESGSLYRSTSFISGLLLILVGTSNTVERLLPRRSTDKYKYINPINSFSFKKNKKKIFLF